MSLDDYLRRFAEHSRVTVVGPLCAETPPSQPPPHPQPQPLRNLADPLIWVDGGADYRRGNVGFAVGDGDSSHGKLDQYLAVDKDCSDLAYVLRRLPPHFNEVILLGFLGARRDHELFNLGEVHHFLRATNQPTQARFAHRIHAYSKGEWNFIAHGVFSLAVFAATTVQLIGACKFPLPSPTQIQPLTSLGLSNRGHGKITLRTAGPAFIFKPYYNAA